MTIPAHRAYAAVFVGVSGHTRSEFFPRLPGVGGPETSVWRYLPGGLGLVLWAPCCRESGDLLTPLRREPFNTLWLSVMPVTVT